MEVTNQDLLQVNEVVSKRWHNLGYRIVTLPDVFGHPDEFRFRCVDTN